MSDRIFAAVWLVLCIVGMVIAWQIQSEYSYEPVGPRPFPLLLLGLMAICAVMMLLRKPDAVQWPVAATLKKLLALCVMLMVYGWLFEKLGFALCTTLLTFGIGMLFGARWWAAVLSGVVMGVALFYAFDRLLDVTLPVGSWFS
ncbi:MULTISPECIES: tripartite tricarboxylate transporter TctB family protein [Pantoea]|jgi:putative tricarboxylic transport membrane protein|uniref:Tripartite tricarboxylate transporter TctB family protein n=1 Tax=Pantoea dispersa TaxID=59814 RepID=A0ABY3A1P8_9GAMM|nr:MULTISPECIES: tripartite tricarboxylate transporter TctB family protein [Pantoea]MBK4771440.1 tripartite tricarboxylate transporter TctB family protein [Pantoea sp. Morm]KAA8667237.1 tripartite tricarboxylate transporter TctB family protein [Pantoea dispersa]KAF0853612.1 membrane protein [Pantoea dispersa 625]KTS18192.1 membrane protein [Pantoea dispersa]KTS36576.1 membrane protein [Pantoea dispersa]